MTMSTTSNRNHPSDSKLRRSKRRNTVKSNRSCHCLDSSSASVGGGGVFTVVVIALVSVAAVQRLPTACYAFTATPMPTIQSLGTNDFVVQSNTANWSSRQLTTNWQLYSSTSTQATTSSKKQKKKKGGKKATTKASSNSSSKRNSPSNGQPVTLDEVGDRVSTTYIKERMGAIHQQAQKKTRATLDATSNCDTGSASSGGAGGKCGLWGKEQEDYMKMLNGRPALVLNANYMPLSYLPLSLWPWQDAIKAVFSGKVSVVDVYPDITVRAANIEVPVPSIIALNDYVSHKNQRPAFTRRNVYLRDEYRCQYCGNHFHTHDLSLDHVVPRSSGGVLSWENAVTSCLKCNGKKGSTPVSDLKSIGMKLLRQPSCPTQMELAARAARMVPKRVHPTWKPYLGIAERPSSSSSKSREGDEDYIDDRYFETEV